MKTVFSSNSDLIHFFATQPEQNHAKSSSVFFYGKKLYSYGYHYLLAEYLDANNVVINDTGYSVSTAKHIGICRSAFRQYNVFYFSNACPKNVLNSLVSLENSLKKAKKPEKYISEINHIISEYLRFNAEFPQYFSDLDSRYSEYSTNLIPVIERLKNLKNVNLSEYVKESAKREREEKKNALKIWETAFHSFDTENVNMAKYRQMFDFDLIRINGDILETTQNVKVPLDRAKKLYKALKSGLNILGKKIEYYTINSIDEKYIRIGCHKIRITDLDILGA